MTKLSRRGAIFGAIVVGTAWPIRALAAAAVELPESTMRLTRRLERSLSGNARIVVERCWDVRFTPQGRGCSITGHQSKVDVDAPAELAGMAQIEERRSTDSMFPILLSETGMIVAAGNDLLKEDIARAAREAERLIAERAISAEAKAEQMRYLALLQQSAGKLLEQLPDDLFFPVSAPVHTIEPVQLAGGQSGEFELSYRAECAPGRAWLGRAERLVITRIEASERRASEVWSMTQI